MVTEMDEEHLQLLNQNFQDNLQSAVSRRTDMFLSSVAEYFQMCTNSQGNCNEVGRSFKSSDESQLKQELDLAQSEQKKAEELILLLRSALKVSQAVNERHLNKMVITEKSQKKL